MKFRKKLSKRTLTLFAAAVLLLAGSSLVVTLAAPDFVSDDFVGEIDVNHIGVELVENGKAVSGSLKLSKLPASGKIVPGNTYEEVISARNSSNVDNFVRMIVRTYWTKDGETVKETGFDPKFIELGYGKSKYNTSEWSLNPEETTTESKTYYRKKILKASETSDLFNNIKINNNIVKNVEVTTEESEEGTTYIYTYEYDGYQFNVEAEVQALQTHNINDAIGSKWGVTNVSASGDTLTVK